MKNEKNILIRSIFLAIVVVIFCASCKKESINEEEKKQYLNEAMAISVDHNNAVQPFHDSYSIILPQFEDLANDMLRMQNGRPKSPEDIQGCYTTTITPSKIWQWPKTVIRDFGTACTGTDGKVRSGKIISVFSAPLFNEGATATTTYEEYVVDSFRISGKMITTNDFKYSGQDTSYAIRVSLKNARASHVGSGLWSEVNGEITYTQQKRSPNYFVPFSPFYTTGILTGENSLNISWKAEVAVPVLRSFECAWPLSGVLSLQWNSHPDKATIDYGKGSCDNNAYLSYKGVGMDIRL